ncbi:hypothetical protein ACFWZ7_21965 [Nocardiopsis alba]|uniref:hypothetical protein n=1 Tax=Nocardiopsis alba TaxID=53437 RepID=UPI00366F0857
MTSAPSNRELQLTAAQILAGLLSVPDLPELTWNLHAIGGFTDSYTPPCLGIDLLEGHASSHQAVRDWAAHLGAEVTLRHGVTPDARLIVKGLHADVVVKIWCAPEHRDDLPSGRA